MSWTNRVFLIPTDSAAVKNIFNSGQIEIYLKFVDVHNIMEDPKLQ